MIENIGVVGVVMDSWGGGGGWGWGCNRDNRGQQQHRLVPHVYFPFSGICPEGMNSQQSLTELIKDEKVHKYYNQMAAFSEDLQGGKVILRDFLQTCDLE